MELLINLIVAVLLICVLIWAVRALTGAFAVGEPIATVLQVVVVLIALVAFFGLVGFPAYHPLRR